MSDFPEFITRLPELDFPIDGLTGHLLQGENQQVAFLKFAREVDVPDHSHRAQFEIVLDGEVRLRMNGEEKTYTRGMTFYIPEGTEHGARVGAGFQSVVVFDQKDRYKAK